MSVAEDDEDWMDRIRVMACPECNGDGGGESAPYGVNYNDGSPFTTWIRCPECSGLGIVWQEVEPITMEDLNVT